MILSEINGLLDVSEKTKDFLKWLVNFERDNIEREQFAYKQEIERKATELLVDLPSEG